MVEAKEDTASKIRELVIIPGDILVRTTTGMQETNQSEVGKESDYTVQ